MADIITGQYVKIMQTPASIGERMAAQLIDWVVMVAYYFLFYYIFDTLSWVSFTAVLLFLILPILFYSLLCEIFNNGQTIGKWFMKTRVVMKDGTTPSLGSYLLRWLLWIVDGPTLSFLGVFVILINKHNQRIGDIAAGTMVIRLNSYSRLQVSLDEFDFLSSNYRPTYPQAADLSLEQVNLISKTLELEMDDPRISALAAKVRSTLGIQTVHERSDMSFLWQLVRDYQYYALEEI